jgi:cytochrome c peroxidase
LQYSFGIDIAEPSPDGPERGSANEEEMVRAMDSKWERSRLGAAIVGTLLAALAGCGGGTAGSSAGPATALSAQAALGEKIFKDVSLSASGRQACASCHADDSAHSPANDLAAQFGGPLLDRQGGRSAPSARYLAGNTAFFFDAEGTPTGGFFWDGRATSLQDQAGQPLLNPVEMANASRAEVVERLARASYAGEFRQLFGSDIFSRVDDAFDRITLSLQQYQREDADFHPFTSKYDEFLRGNTRLSDAEMRGLALFNSPSKGNCAGCHPSARAADGSHPLFTDFSYDNLGVPRNPALEQNRDPAFFDLGLCARPGGDLAARTDLCGAFKVPSLRNVALRRVYFHNGRFDTLEETLTFYVQRDTQPEKWYPLNADGSVNKFDDLPAAYRGNVNTSEAPYDRAPGQAPALSDAEIDDVIAFLRTLSDGFTP